MKNKLLYSVGLLMLMNLQLLAQKVPYSDHASDQLLQGPCYIFATVAAMESKALQAQGQTQGGHSGVNINEWRYWSDCVLGGSNGVPNASLSQLVTLPLQHMIDYGAMEAGSAFNFTSAASLPNYSPLDCGDFNGIASFGCTTGGGPFGNVGNLDWCNTLGGYQSGTQCPEDIVGNDSFNFTQSATSPDYSFSNLSIHHITSNFTPQKVIDQLAAGNGVVAVIDNYGFETCNGASAGIQHAIFIYEHTNGVFYYKDSWPGGATNRNQMTTGQFSNHQVRRLTYVSGGGGCTNCGDTPCDFSISGSSTLGCSNTTYQLTGGTGSATNISWQFPTGVTVVSGANSSTITVRSDNTGSSFSGQISVTYSDVSGSCSDTFPVTVCASVVDQPCDFSVTGPSTIGCTTSTFHLTGGSGSATNISWQVPSGVTIVSGATSTTLRVKANNCSSSFSGQISASYSDINSCTASRSVTVSGGNVSTVSSIQLNGPASGQISDVCPGSAVQLVAIDNNSAHCPIYEWYVSGATILNGQGTNEINILTNNVDGAYQYYRVRVKKACGSYTSWRTRTGYLDDCSGGGGIGIFPGFQFSQQLGADEIFQGHPSLMEMDVQIISLSGKKLSTFRISRNNNAIDLSELPKGILVARFVDLNNNLLDTKKISIVR
ncbi:MAG: hypothetical protein R8G66_33030 [Cytophagales bacterium]|nr:hypothetical protein [Cytophagales bacterium]